MSIAAAAAAWNVPAEEYIAANSVITHGPSGRTTTFGGVAAEAADMAPPAQTRLKDPKDWKLIGTRQRRLDVPDKVTGKPIYAIDVHLPGMLYTAIVQCPVFKGTLRSVDEAELAGMKGIRRVVKLPDAVVADSWWRAKKAAEALSVNWDFAGHADVSSDTRFASSCMRAWVRGMHASVATTATSTAPLVKRSSGSKRTTRCLSSATPPWSRKTARRT